MKKPPQNRDGSKRSDFETPQAIHYTTYTGDFTEEKKGRDLSYSE
jgi:hypothetical protein